MHCPRRPLRVAAPAGGRHPRLSALILGPPDGLTPSTREGSATRACRRSGCACAVIAALRRTHRAPVERGWSPPSDRSRKMSQALTALTLRLEPRHYPHGLHHRLSCWRRRLRRHAGRRVRRRSRRHHPRIRSLRALKGRAHASASGGPAGFPLPPLQSSAYSASRRGGGGRRDRSTLSRRPRHDHLRTLSILGRHRLSAGCCSPSLSSRCRFAV